MVHAAVVRHHDPHRGGGRGDELPARHRDCVPRRVHHVVRQCLCVELRHLSLHATQRRADHLGGGQDEERGARGGWSVRVLGVLGVDERARAQSKLGGDQLVRVGEVRGEAAGG